MCNSACLMYSYCSMWTVALVDRFPYTFCVENKRVKSIKARKTCTPKC